MDKNFTYKGNLEAMMFVKNVLNDIEPEHKCYQSAPSNFYTLSSGARYHVIAYNMPKSGIKIMARKCA